MKSLVLCCDDEISLCEIVADELNYLGYETVMAHSGQEALKKLESTPIHAIVSDVRMPNGDGFFLLKGIKDHLAKSKPPVLLLTGHTELPPEDIYALGATALLAKPVDYQILASQLARALESPDTRWSRPDQRPAKGPTLAKSFESLEHAKQAKAFHLGLGGFFVAHSSPNWPEMGQRQDFELSFTQDARIPTLKGSGTVRWLRTSPKEDLPPGYGLEFEHLDSASVQNFLRIYEELRNSMIFIPHC